MKFGFLNTDTMKSASGIVTQLNAAGYNLFCSFCNPEGDELALALRMLDGCDVVFAAGDRPRFLQIFGLKDFGENSFAKGTLLYIFLENSSDVAGIESAIREHYTHLNISMSVFRIFLEQGKTPKFDSVFHPESFSGGEKFLLSRQQNGDFLDVIMRHRCDIRLSSLNKLFLDNYFNHIYATGFSNLSRLVVLQGIKNNLKLKIAESFTGGAVASEIVSVAGASNFLIESLVTYSEQSKIDRLAVDSDCLANHGVISREAAYEMAKSLYKSGCDIAVATTGNAGPLAQNGGCVGKCFIAIAAFGKIEVFEYDFSGDRQDIIRSGTTHTLFLLYRKLMLSYTR